MAQEVEPGSRLGDKEGLGTLNPLGFRDPKLQSLGFRTLSPKVYGLREVKGLGTLSSKEALRTLNPKV